MGNRMIASFAAIAVSALVLGCLSQDAAEGGASGKLKVVATIFPLYDMAKGIGAERADVTLITRPGSEVHSVEPTPDKVARLAEADLFIENGLGLEPWAPKVVLASGNKGLEVVDASEGIQALRFQGGEGVFDPHVFQDPVLAQMQLANIEVAFIRRDPANERYYRDNAESYRKRLQAVDGDYRRALSDCGVGTVLVNHAFLGYAAKEYGFTQVSITGLNPEAEPRPQDLAEAISKARESHAKYILYESTVSPKTVEVVAAEANISILAVSTAHEITADDFQSGKTYPELLEEDLAALKKAMECG